jgi:hypothetical protein
MRTSESLSSQAASIVSQWKSPLLGWRYWAAIPNVVFGQEIRNTGKEARDRERP